MSIFSFLYSFLNVDQTKIWQNQTLNTAQYQLQFGTERKLRREQGSNFKTNESVLRIKLITPKINCNHVLVNDVLKGSTDTVVKNSHFCLNCSNIIWLLIWESNKLPDFPWGQVVVSHTNLQLGRGLGVFQSEHHILILLQQQ